MKYEDIEIIENKNLKNILAIIKKLAPELFKKKIKLTTFKKTDALLNDQCNNCKPDEITGERTCEDPFTYDNLYEVPDGDVIMRDEMTKNCYKPSSLKSFYNANKEKNNGRFINYRQEYEFPDEWK